MLSIATSTRNNMPSKIKNLATGTWFLISGYEHLIE